jgi:hypothetical protein
MQIFTGRHRIQPVDVDAGFAADPGPPSPWFLNPSTPIFAVVSRRRRVGVEFNYLVRSARAKLSGND